MPEQIYLAISVAMLATFALSLGLWAGDARSINGIGVVAQLAPEA